MAKKKYYAVAVGKSPGVYTRYETAWEQLRGFKGSILKGFDDIEEAKTFINVTRAKKGLEKIEIKTITEPPLNPNIYVVLIGRETGIYLSLEEAKKQTNKFPGGLFKRVSSKEEAKKLLKVYQGESNKSSEDNVKKKKTKFYVVVKGFNPGIYNDLKDVKQQIKGYINPEIHSFKTRESAEKFAADLLSNSTTAELEKNTVELSEKENGNLPEENSVKLLKTKKMDSPKKKKGKKKKKKKKTAVVYVDGSYNNFIKKSSYACVIVYKNHEEYLSGSFVDIDNLHNVSGELKAAMKAMEYCVNKGIKRLTIYYDFNGIEKFCKKEHKASKDYIKSYKKYVKKVSKKIDVSFKKVKAHSGDKYNEIADKLAKHALMLYAA